MIKNLTINDETQISIINHLETTAKLLSQISTKLSKKEKKACIYAMPDLGIAQNITRMMGGFYTGACYTWDTDIPFVPVDATVNVCGTAVYKLKKNITNKEFIDRLNKITEDRNTYLEFLQKYMPKEMLASININDQSKFYWNYNKGNHFVILAESNGEYNLEKGQYMIVHASAIEFKKDNLKYGLYPTKGNWFYDDIKIEHDKKTNRYVRYITGEKAKKFYDIATFLKDFNKSRNKYFCEMVLGELMEKEIINISHYGMPTNNSICIGSQWEQKDYTLLTAPGNDIFLVHPNKNNANNITINKTNITLTPHGCGVKTNNPQDKIEYQKNKIKIGNKIYEPKENMKIGIDSSIRTKGMSNDQLNEHIKKILLICPGTIFGRLSQKFARTKDGDIIYKND